jgi:aminoglycoside phosphotransferase (APT) family kinase protein
VVADAAPGMRAAPIDIGRLTGAMRRHLGVQVVVDEVRLLGGGASRQIYAVDVIVSGERRALVLRRDPEGRAEAAARRVEFDVVTAAYAAGVAAPKPWFALDEADGLGSGYLMARVDGETIASRILRERRLERARSVMARQCGEILARIHSVDLAGLPGLPAVPAGRTPAAAALAAWRDTYDELAEPHPAIEVGLRWLQRHEPATAAAVLVHGDFRNGNLVVGEDGIRAVLDWELAHRGDPLEDLGWLCIRAWRFGRDELTVGGFGTVQDLIDGYESIAGRSVDRRALRYWEVFGNLKWAVICMLQASAHLTGAQPSMELAAVGRRACEAEWDLLSLIEAEDG